MNECTQCGSSNVHSTADLTRVTDECQECGHTETDL